MKKIIFTLLLIVPFVLQAQNYTNICSPGATFYNKINTNNVKAYKTTAITVPGGGDTIFYSFPTVRDTAADCLDTTKGSILGRKIYRRDFDKMFVHFNKRNDSIFVYTRALLDDAWKFYALTPGTMLEAKVISVSNESVLGVLNEVKTVELQAKRNDGTPITSPWNGKTFKMSKNYGLIRIFDLVNMPSDTTTYVLAGKFKPVIGIQDFGWQEVYSFNIGDVLHYSGYNNSLTGGPNSTWKEIQTVFAKQTWGSNIDSAEYKFDRCRSTLTNPGGQHVYVRDTLVVRYKYTQLANDSAIWRFPDEFDRENVYASKYDRFMKAFNDRQTKKVGEDRYRFLNNCFVIPAGSIIFNRSYSEGLGITETFRDDQSTQEYNKLVYFKKGSETWGNAVGTECSPILGGEEQMKAAPSVKIVPNPMKNQAKLVVEGIQTGNDLQFVLFNLVGKEVYRTSVGSSPLTLDRNNLPSGLYIYVLKGKEVNLNGKLMID